MSGPVTASVRILDKEYRVSCEENEQEELTQAASYLDQEMRKIRGSGKVIGLDRIAVMAALNIAHEMLTGTGAAKGKGKGKAKGAEDSATEPRVTALLERIERTLEVHRQLEL